MTGDVIAGRRNVSLNLGYGLDLHLVKFDCKFDGARGVASDAHFVGAYSQVVPLQATLFRHQEALDDGCALSCRAASRLGCVCCRISLDS